MEDSLRSQGKSLKLFPETFVVLQCAPEMLPLWRTLERGRTNLSFCSVSVSSEECSVIAPEKFLVDLLKEEESQLEAAHNKPSKIILKQDKDWRCFKVEGPLDFSLVGILHAILEPLKQAGISVLAVGTFDTDYFLVKQDNLEKAHRILQENEFYVSTV